MSVSYIAYMATTTNETQQKNQAWKGDASMPQVLQMLGLRVPLSVVARSFGVSRRTIYKRLNKPPYKAFYEQLKEKNPPAPLSSDAGKAGQHAGTVYPEGEQHA